MIMEAANLLKGLALEFEKHHFGLNLLVKVRHRSNKNSREGKKSSIS